jgi:hypothetical protein
MIQVPKKDSVYELQLFLFSLLGFLIFEDGPVGCPETSVRISYSVLFDIPVEHTSHLAIW